MVYHLFGAKTFSEPKLILSLNCRKKVDWIWIKMHHFVSRTYIWIVVWKMWTIFPGLNVLRRFSAHISLAIWWPAGFPTDSILRDAYWISRGAVMFHKIFPTILNNDSSPTSFLTLMMTEESLTNIGQTLSWMISQLVLGHLQARWLPSSISRKCVCVCIGKAIDLIQNDLGDCW